MTRLSAVDIAHIADDLTDYDADLVSKTGCSLREIACRAAGISESKIRKLLPELMVGVIPVTSGRGRITGFSDVLVNIISHMHSSAFVTKAPDVAGLVETYENKADVIMLADDDCFAAIDLQSRRVVDNAQSTGKAFATGLSLMVGDLNDRQVLVIGCGPVGCSAAEALVRMGACVSVFDIDSRRSKKLAQAINLSLQTKVDVAPGLETALRAHRIIVDASPAANIIDAGHIKADTFISAPGVPCGINAPAKAKLSKRLLHDTLPLGVAVMLVDTVKYRLNLENTPTVLQTNSL